MKFTKITPKSLQSVLNICKIYGGIPVHLDEDGFTTEFDVEFAINEYTEWKYFKLDTEGLEASDFLRCNGADHTDIPIAEFIAELIKYSNENAVETMKLNSHYTATIHRNGDVEVGCQTFPASVVIALAEKVQKKLAF
jgi:hypothetical protein